jgi:hypothetical protein
MVSRTGNSRTVSTVQAENIQIIFERLSIEVLKINESWNEYYNVKDSSFVSTIGLAFSSFHDSKYIT